MSAKPDARVPVLCSYRRDELDERDTTAVQCEGCGRWTVRYWTVNAIGEDCAFHFCPICEPRALSRYGGGVDL